MQQIVPVTLKQTTITLFQKCPIQKIKRTRVRHLNFEMSRGEFRHRNSKQIELRVKWP